MGQGVVLMIGAVVVIVLVPVAIIALLLGIGAAGWVGLRRGIARLRRPNGALDGRRNVRVRMPESTE